jgi:hypothetical protein
MTLDEIINLQTVVGSFSLPEDLISTLPGSATKPEFVEKITKHLKTLGRWDCDESDLADKIYVTLLIIFILERRFRDERDMWSLVTQKARTWVQDCLEDEELTRDLEFTLREKVNL